MSDEDNVEAATILVRRIQERIKDPTVAKIGSVWQFTGRENVNDFGAYIARMYKEKPWKN